uniref:Uncharacterized protein n=1 Tax=Lepeophtheirus salmonis TaxID=72036 RepID=A0A0K2V2G6_LEPSM
MMSGTLSLDIQPYKKALATVLEVILGMRNWDNIRSPCILIHYSQVIELSLDECEQANFIIVGEGKSR